MEYGALNAMIENLGTYASVADVRPHRFRHTFACRFYRETRDVLALKNILGHAKIVTTERYLRTLGVEYGMTEYNMDRLFDA